MPAPATRIVWEVVLSNQVSPSEIIGVVVYDTSETDASFVCVVKVKDKALNVAEDETVRYEVSIATARGYLTTLADFRHYPTK